MGSNCIILVHEEQQHLCRDTVKIKGTDLYWHILHRKYYLYEDVERNMFFEWSEEWNVRNVSEEYATKHSVLTLL